LCNSTLSIDAKTWEDLDATAQWQKGVGNIFYVDYNEKQLSARDDDFVLKSIKVRNRPVSHYLSTAVQFDKRRIQCKYSKIQIFARRNAKH